MVDLDSKFMKRQAWALTMQLVQQVWNDLYFLRLGALDNVGGNQSSMCKAVLWAVFRTHDLMETYKVANFDNHPSIISPPEYVKFLATNLGFEQMEAVQKEIASLVCQNKELSQTAEKHKKRLIKQPPWLMKLRRWWMTQRRGFQCWRSR